MRSMQSERGQRGFTLVEIMVVVVIIGLLATVVASNVLGDVDTAKLNTVKSDISTIKDAVTRYYLKNSRIPESLEELVQEDESGHRQLDLEEVPKDPWGNEYVLESEGGSKFVVICYGPDQEMDTEDDITTKNMRQRKTLNPEK
ncbi:MAG: type II secretion system protein GspG [Planctomycetota bacterium]